MAIHQVKIGRRRRRIWKRRQNPMDVTLRARLAIRGIGPDQSSTHIVDIPVDKAWRATLGRTVLVTLLPEECLLRELRYFPEQVRRKQIDGRLRLDDLLHVGDAELRVFAFAYRPYVGTRWMRRGTYTAQSIRPGVFEDMRIASPADEAPPKRPDLSAAGNADAPQGTHVTPGTYGHRQALVLRLGGWSIHLRRQKA